MPDASAIKLEQLDDAWRLVSDLVNLGAHSLLDNAPGVEMRAFEIQGWPVPVAACAPARNRASFLSPTAHYLDYPIGEIARRSRVWNRTTLRAALLPLRVVMRFGEIDLVVYANHWLTVTRPSLGLDRSGIEELIPRLRELYPNRAIVFSNIVPAVSGQVFDDLCGAGCMMIPSRRVWFFDAGRPMKGKPFDHIRRTLNKQRRLLEREKPHGTGRESLLTRLPEVRQLYRSVHIQKHSRMNPDYNESFFGVMLNSRLVDGQGWVSSEGGLDAFSLNLRSMDRILWSIGGYDHKTGGPRTQLISAWHIEQTRSLQGVLHWGGGADEYKRNRGGISAQEFDAVYVNHLPRRRRLPWDVLQRLRQIRAPLTANWSSTAASSTRQAHRN